MTQRLLETAGFVGISSLEAKRHEVTGEHVLMEINVRIPQNIGLGEAAGVEPSWRIYATLAGIPLPPQRPQRDGVRVIVPSLEVHAAPAYVRQGDLSLRQLLGSYGSVRNVSGLSLTDPGPLAAFARDRGSSAARSIARRLGPGWPALATVPSRSAEGDGPARAAPRGQARLSPRPGARAAPGPAGRQASPARPPRARHLGSPLYGTLLEQVADDVAGAGSVLAAAGRPSADASGRDRPRVGAADGRRAQAGARGRGPRAGPLLPLRGRNRRRRPVARVPRHGRGTPRAPRRAARPPGADERGRPLLRAPERLPGWCRERRASPCGCSRWGRARVFCFAGPSTTTSRARRPGATRARRSTSRAPMPPVARRSTSPPPSPSVAAATPRRSTRAPPRTGSR